jgi:outer membrane protein, protease secretion system
MSLYAGGGTEASVRQSTLSRDAAQADLDAQVAETLAELRKQYDLCRSAPTKIRAYERAVQSAELLVEATRRSVEGGTRVNLDVLNAEQQLSQARRDLAASKYTYLKAQLELRRHAGVLEAEDLQRIGAYFAAEARPVAAAGVVRAGQAKP